ncbi:MAG: hypothetical protein GQ556_01355 [Desulfobacterales bacterium]|nr:hypothetical protein [Desulfobacterales bacterium]
MQPWAFQKIKAEPESRESLPGNDVNRNWLLVIDDEKLKSTLVLRQGSNGVILRRNLLCLQGVTL